VLPSSEFISRVLIKFVSNNNDSFAGGRKTERLFSLYEKKIPETVHTHPSSITCSLTSR
jgi:hypothetical protein